MCVCVCVCVCLFVGMWTRDIAASSLPFSVAKAVPFEAEIMSESAMLVERLWLLLLLWELDYIPSVLFTRHPIS